MNNKPLFGKVTLTFNHKEDVNKDVQIECKFEDIAKVFKKINELQAKV